MADYITEKISLDNGTNNLVIRDGEAVHVNDTAQISSIHLATRNTSDNGWYGESGEHARLKWNNDSLQWQYYDSTGNTYKVAWIMSGTRKLTASDNLQLINDIPDGCVAECYFDGDSNPLNLPSAAVGHGGRVTIKCTNGHYIYECIVNNDSNRYVAKRIRGTAAWTLDWTAYEYLTKADAYEYTRSTLSSLPCTGTVSDQYYAGDHYSLRWRWDGNNIKLENNQGTLESPNWSEYDGSTRMKISTPCTNADVAATATTLSISAKGSAERPVYWTGSTFGVCSDMVPIVFNSFQGTPNVLYCF